ncbi:YfiR family protein [Pseudoduganella namucuonensis]|uniref:DUF4154 domain-containing protein n=1 Tax=Pseudoduganella namucuonensis TaxID=1035707 RepID=A0A1I7LX04_9BURK|nr:YfiR family protein [Pseudoduganella namucuonensis]SFV14198.1 protein of unknown function [Pseudoduganella namucuonensis]
MAILSPAGDAGLTYSTARHAPPDGPPAAQRWRAAAQWLNGLALLALLLLTLSCLAVGADPPAAAPNVERGVKAAFLYKFLGYVEYPQHEAGAAGPLVVGVLGADDIAAELTRITAGRAVNNRAVVVRALREGDPPAGLQMLFVGSEAARGGQVLRAAQQNGVLTVTETDNGLQQGSVINFRLVEDRVRFEVSLPAAEKSGLKLSSRLLSVAYHVQKGAP